MEPLPQYLQHEWLLESPYIQAQDENPCVPNKYIPILQNIDNIIISPLNIYSIIDFIEFFQLSNTTKN